MDQRRYACDSCRRRRVKCDATQPCGTCVRSGITCTYGSSTSRVSATSYARNLEQQVAELQNKLQVLTSSVTSAANSPPRPAIDTLIDPNENFVIRQIDGVRVYQSSAALNVLRLIANIMSSVPGASPAPDLPGEALVGALETPRELPPRGPLEWLGALLTSEDAVWTTIAYALDNALIFHHCIDKATFRARLHHFFQLSQDTVTAESNSFLALIYAAMALGELFEAMEDNSQDANEARPRRIRGLSNFRASHSILHDDRERYDLDTVVAFMIHARYLTSISTFTNARAALDSAASVAMHMGLHLDDTPLRADYTNEQLYERRRVFAVINMMDTYLAWPLGLPRILRGANRKQVLGLREDDLADEGESFISEHPESPESETVLCQKLLKHHATIYERLTGLVHTSTPNTDWISDIEKELEEWQDELPEFPDSPIGPRVLKGQLILRLHYASTLILLYAPFLHHLSRERSNPAFSLAGYEYASNGVRAAMQVVVIVETLSRQHMLNAAHWVNAYVLAWSATVLTYFVLHSRTRVTIRESKIAALKADKMLEMLGRTNHVAQRIHEVITPLMEMVSNLEEAK